MIDRWMAFNAARKQSRAFAPAVAGALRDGKIDEAIKVAERNKRSHLAKVVTAGLMEFRAHQDSSDIPGETIEASKRALERTEAIVHAELKRGLGGLATIGSTAPFVGLFGTVMGILNAFKGISHGEGDRSDRGGRRYRGSARDDGFRTASRDPGGDDVQLPHRARGSVRRGDGQLVERTDRLLPEAPRSSAAVTGSLRELSCLSPAARRCRTYLPSGATEQSNRRICRGRRTVMAISVRDEGAKVNSNINVTPMVDVMLVLLIIFMVITPMLQHDVSGGSGAGQQSDADEGRRQGRRHGGGHHPHRRSLLRQGPASRTPPN